MVAFVNPREITLDNAIARVFDADNVALILTADSDVFSVDVNNNPVFPTIEFKVQIVGWEGAVTWSCIGGTLSAITENSASLAYSSLTGTSATVTVKLIQDGKELEVATRRISIIKQGAGAKLVELTPSGQVFRISKTNTVSPDSITLLAKGQNTTGTPSFTVPTGDITLNAGATNFEKVLTYANMRSDTAVVKVTLDGQEDTVTIVKLREGLDGANAIHAVMTNEAVVLPANSAGAVASYAGAQCKMVVFDGLQDATSQWGFTFAPASNATLTYDISGSTATVTQLASNTEIAYIDITAARAGYTSITKRFNISKSRAGGNGQRGAGHFYAVNNMWSDAVADAATPGGNVIDDVVTIYDGSTVAIDRKWNGSAWVDMPKVVNGGQVLPGTIQTGGIANNAATDMAVISYTTVDGYFEIPNAGSSALDLSKFRSLADYTFTPPTTGHVLIHYYVDINYQTSSAVTYYDVPLIRVDIQGRPYDPAGDKPPNSRSGANILSGPAVANFIGGELLWLEKDVPVTLLLRAVARSDAGYYHRSYKSYMVVEIIKK